MGPRSVVVAAALGLPGAHVVAQPAPEPPALKLPVGARVRVRVVQAPGPWMRGVLAGADSGTVALIPEGAPPFAGSEFRLPLVAISRLEIATGKKRHWLAGLAIGAAAGVALGFAMDVDSTRCEFDDNYFCSRGEALALTGGTFAGLGAGIGALVKTDVWIPVALDTLGPPPRRVGQANPGLRATPGGLSLGFAVRF